MMFFRIMIDTRISVDLFFLTTIKALGLKEFDIVKEKLPLVRFNINTTYAIGTMVLLIMEKGIIVMTIFVVIDVLKHYNTILGRPWIHTMRGVPSSFHQVIKSLTDEGLSEKKGN